MLSTIINSKSLMLARALFGGLLIASVGCSNQVVKQPQQSIQEAYELQKPLIVNKSGIDERPTWVAKTHYEENGIMYFSGAFLNGADYAVSVRCANAEAMKVVVQGISQFIRAEFSEFSQGDNTAADGVDRYVSDGIATFVQTMHLQGVRQTAVYYEETFSLTVMQPTYNVFVQLQMSKAEYLKAKADALQRLSDRFRDTGQSAAQRKADKLLDELKRDVEHEFGNSDAT
jgi:hypothetical protein